MDANEIMYFTQGTKVDLLNNIIPKNGVWKGMIIKILLLGFACWGFLGLLTLLIK